ncbi:hypothetical protein C8J57DRAFT_1405319 [Mycena rebaudengoi]|nr:hypothetical protein C8J57DRAFT_1405319 [Mycena rebaudengoi]
MPPFPSEKTPVDIELGLPTLVQCSNNTSGVSSCAIIFVFFLLVFYALALWDRWLNLKLRETQKLQFSETRTYGATVLGSQTPITPSRPPSPAAGGHYPYATLSPPRADSSP